MSLSLELTQAAQRDGEGCEANGAERVRKVFGTAAIDVPHEAQGEVQLRIILPARARNAAPEREQTGADLCRGANGDEKTVHAVDIGWRWPDAIARSWLELRMIYADNELAGRSGR